MDRVLSSLIFMFQRSHHASIAVLVYDISNLGSDLPENTLFFL